MDSIDIADKVPSPPIKDISVSPSDGRSMEEAVDAASAGRKKADRNILIWYSFVYLVMRVHVSNISNSAIMNLEQGTGIEKQLGNLNSQQWAWVLSIFYYPYMFAEPLATLALKRFGPNVWMSRIMVSWGIVSMCQAATQNYAGILTTRFFLGLCEAGFYPGVLYHLSFWYPTDRLPLRIRTDEISLQAYAISFMNGIRGLAGWRWLFILEGMPAILCGIYTYFFLPNCKLYLTLFLKPEEKEALRADLAETAPDMKAKTWNFDQLKTAFKDPTFIPFTLIWIGHGIGGFGITFVLPTVIYQLGMTDTAISQIMTMPPYTFNFIFLVTIAYFVHKGRLSSWVAALGIEALQILCYILLITVNDSVARYIFVMIATAASQSFYFVTERIRAAHGTTAAGVAIGMTNGAAQLMGIVGPQIYQSKFGPYYHVSYACSIGLLCFACMAIGTCWYFVVRNDCRSRQPEISEADESAVSSIKTES
ncbi:high-affinity nicotinic acid transporter [Penicillium riverlandense]|uniref:high-affinity nicotinic acid transporter n=1 Tax=Penicillium riverlandense TaxID=1903569 RepID=UPI0025482ECC|nr:high-affinity nicotinic acid transporter [Penicillium riverlandense]KAJ5818726.1 high-affinity nicotinic acid transporter [Penicillium riverlandense]